MKGSLVGRPGGEREKMSEDLVETVKYISQREEELSNYSDKLRQSLIRVFNTFGDPEECAICGRREDSDAHFEYTTYNEWGNYLFINEEKKNELIATGKYVEGTVLGRWKAEDGKIIIEKNKDVHAFIPKIRLSLPLSMVLFRVANPESQYEPEEKWGLTTYEGRLLIMYESPNDEQHFHRVSDVSRKVLKELVKSRAISQFLNEYVKLLDQTTNEYQEVSSLAEKLAGVLG